MGKLTSSSAGVPPASRNVSIPPTGLMPSNPLAAVLLLLVVCLTCSASDQPAPPTIPTPPATKDVTPTNDKSPATAPEITEAVNITPSRFVTPEALSDYVTSRSAVFAMRNRTTDPFGQLQDPTAVRVIKTTVAKPTRRIAPLQVTPFSDIIRLIKITTVMPKEKRFLVGSRSFKQGDRIPLAFRGKNIPVEIFSVTSTQIEFHNLENNETASIKLNHLPEGVTLGTFGSTPPGMVKDMPEAALELDPGNLPNTPNENSKNR